MLNLILLIILRGGRGYPRPDGKPDTTGEWIAVIVMGILIPAIYLIYNFREKNRKQKK